MKSMLNITLLFLLTYFSGCASQTENISQYFPLNEGDVYTYHGKYKNKNYNNSYLVRSFTRSNRQKLYYFQKGIIKQNNTLIKNNMFGNGLYFVNENQLWTLEALSDFELFKLDYNKKQRLLPEDLSIGNKITFDSNFYNSKDTIEILSYEDINVPAGQFKNCLKLKITSHWNKGDIYESYVWLAKNVGLVKWIISTGRVDELVKYQPKHN
jgi:hypothetical protein